MLFRSVPESQHDMITLLFSKQKFVTVEHIDKCLNQSLMYANKFLHLSVNKFLVYSVANKTEHLDIDDLDQRLVAHWISVVNKDVVYVEYNSNDRGYLGNWEYPITNIIWRLHD